MKGHTKKIILILLGLIALSVPQILFADPAPNLQDAFSGDLFNDVSRKGGYSDAYTVDVVIGAVIQGALSLLGVVFLILMVYGGYAWMTSHGDEQKVTKAKNTINAAIIGIIIVVSAYAISYFVVKKLGSRTLRQSTGAEAPPAPPGP